jgi:hypothetical protein
VIAAALNHDEDSSRASFKKNRRCTMMLFLVSAVAFLDIVISIVAFLAARVATVVNKSVHNISSLTVLALAPGVLNTGMPISTQAATGILLVPAPSSCLTLVVVVVVVVVVVMYKKR